MCCGGTGTEGGFPPATRNRKCHRPPPTARILVTKHDVDVLLSWLVSHLNRFDDTTNLNVFYRFIEMMMHSLVLVIFLLFCTSFCPARQWNSHEIAVGEWDVTLRGGWWFNPSHIFPHNSTGERSTCILSSKKWRPWGSTFDCSLSVCADGTFVLTPVAKNHHHHHHRLPLCGQWKVLSNPYCITDRFYDQLVLESYPRVETKQHNHIPLQSVELAMSCRMWGKYASNKRFLFQRSWRRPRGRMTHGTLLVSKRAIPNRKMQRWGRPILASFSAFRSNDIPNHDGWEDEAYFGY